MQEVPPQVCRAMVINQIALGAFYLRDPTCIQECRARIGTLTGFFLCGASLAAASRDLSVQFFILGSIGDATRVYLYHDGPQFEYSFCLSVGDCACIQFQDSN